MDKKGRSSKVKPNSKRFAESRATIEKRSFVDSFRQLHIEYKNQLARFAVEETDSVLRRYEPGLSDDPCLKLRLKYELDLSRKETNPFFIRNEPWPSDEAINIVYKGLRKKSLNLVQKYILIHEWAVFTKRFIEAPPSKPLIGREVSEPLIKMVQELQRFSEENAEILRNLGYQMKAGRHYPWIVYTTLTRLAEKAQFLEYWITSRQYDGKPKKGRPHDTAMKIARDMVQTFVKLDERTEYEDTSAALILPLKTACALAVECSIRAENPVGFDRLYDLALKDSRKKP
ncbi:MAG: hypothetical protein JXA30_02670 [Deltaproteobacteria bacterium]|nr:hypothetical protein [Deltaproteobacteria bacterium]